MSQFPNTRIVDSQLPMVGEIVAATAEVGPAANITYTVRVRTLAGTLEYNSVRPAHRRPSDTLDITAAKPGDQCIVQEMWTGRPKFIIFEGLPDTPCVTPVQAGPDVGKFVLEQRVAALEALVGVQRG